MHSRNHPIISGALSTPGRQRGLTLVEIMVALTIGLILTAGVSQVFISTKQTYAVNEQLSRLQENGRYAVDTMARSLRMAGFQGCSNAASLTPNVIAKSPGPDVVFQAGDHVTGENDVSDKHPLKAAPGTDTVTVRYASPTASRLAEKMTSANANLKLLSNRDRLEQNDVVFVTDCKAADVFKITNTPGSNGQVTLAHGKGSNTTNRLSRPYGADAQVMRFRLAQFFVAPAADGATSRSGAPIMSLWRRSLGGTEELVQGIENMQLLFGEDTDGDGEADDYLAANAVTDMADVVALKVHLLVASVEEVPDAEGGKTYSLGGKKVKASDYQRQRMVFTTTVSIRNRTLRSAKL